MLQKLLIVVSAIAFSPFNVLYFTFGEVHSPAKMMVLKSITLKVLKSR